MGVEVNTGGVMLFDLLFVCVVCCIMHVLEWERMERKKGWPAHP